jgi:hypothetical protein
LKLSSLVPLPEETLVWKQALLLQAWEPSQEQTSPPVQVALQPLMLLPAFHRAGGCPCRVPT